MENVQRPRVPDVAQVSAAGDDVVSGGPLRSESHRSQVRPGFLALSARLHPRLHLADPRTARSMGKLTELLANRHRTIDSSVMFAQVRLYDKAHFAMSCLDFFMTHQWRFVSKNPLKLLERLSERDRKLFYFDVREIDWSVYMERYVLGARRFILKDDMSTVPAAKRNLNR